MEPGIYQDISFPEYNALPYVRNSYLKKIGDSCPAAARLPDDGNKEHLIIGRASHAFILEGEAAFQKDFIVTPVDAPKRPTQAMVNAKSPSAESIFKVNWWEQFAGMAQGKEIISAEDFQILVEMKKSVFAHPTAKLLLADGLSEQTAIFDADMNGETIRCKVRPDRTPSSQTACLVDLKSTVDAGERGFLNACFRFGYFHQAAFYIDGYNTALEVMFKDHGWKREEHPPINAFAFIAIEKKPPYRVEVYTLQGEATYLVEGREKYLENLTTEVRCKKDNYWPNYQNAGAQELVPYSER